MSTFKSIFNFTVLVKSTVHDTDTDSWYKTNQVVMVVWQDLFGVVPARENSLAVRVVGQERDEATSTRRQELNDTLHLRLRLSLLASVLPATRVRARIGCKIVRKFNHRVNKIIYYNKTIKSLYTLLSQMKTTKALLTIIG